MSSLSWRICLQAAGDELIAGVPKWEMSSLHRRLSAESGHSDGRATLSFRVDGLDEIVWWVLGWSGRAKIPRPESLQEMVAEKLQLTLELNRA